MLDMQGAGQSTGHQTSDISGSVEGQAITFPAGPAMLHGRLYLPPKQPVAAVVLNGATGVPMGYYQHFAQWLARERQIACLIYDYRDFGKSAARPLRRSDVSMADWCLVDQPAARAAMRQHLPGVPLWIIGHSLGGMTLPLQDGIEDIDRVIGVASGLVHYTEHPWPYQASVRLFWFGIGPVAVRLAGYMPGKTLGLGADLPPNVYWQWRKWCTSKKFFYDEFGATLPQPKWGKVGAPVRLIAFEDDHVTPATSVRKLSGLYGVRHVTHQVISPADHGLKKIGHLGAFARRNSAVWPTLIGVD